MAKNVEVRSKQALPGAGRDSNGAPVQGKTKVTGVIEVTSYTQGGENLTPSDLKLDAIDFLNLRFVNEMTSNSPGQGVRRAYYSDAAQQFYCSRTRTAGGESELAAGASFVLRFVAEGDSAEAPTLR